MNKEKRVFIRVTDEEKAAFDKAAEISGIALSAWARQKLRSAAIKELEAVSEPIPFLNQVKQKNNGR